MLAALALAPVLGPGGSWPLQAQEQVPATVLSIGDGDSLRVLQGGRPISVRLACIDAPELSQHPYGERSRQYLRTRLRIGSRVRLLPQTVDRYGRTVAEVIAEVNLGLAMVEDGQAFTYRRYLAACNQQDYLEAEFRASRHRFGVWERPGGIPRPWEVRWGRFSREISDVGLP
ncbi:thermonuclease family protein [Cyanobium sp. ATX 6F1]|nr:thermonuclease family protein [Cyanobium sp. ATX 6F1]